jgi:hypothetical protein
MDYITQNYRYPDAVSRDLAALKTNTESHSKTLADLLNSSPQQHAVQTDQRFADITAKLNSLEASIVSVKQSMADGQTTVDQIVGRDLQRLQARQNELSVNLHTAMTECREELTAELAKNTAFRENNSGQPTSTLSISELSSRFNALQEEFQVLETNCFQEMSTINGKIASLAGIIKNKPSASADPVHLMPSAPRREPSRRSPIHKAGQNGGRDESSSDESIIASRRKRKRMSDSKDY